ncbi:MAG: NADH-quinone oxidoreductase subunit L [Phycisphaeraceae bacterium]|nr:NADH-quinone oxidoreductase subunit L [Phycisphaeraceae bacterium]
MVKWIPWISLLSAAICGVLCFRRAWGVWAAPVTITAIAASFVVAMLAAPSGLLRDDDGRIADALGKSPHDIGQTVKAIDWINLNERDALMDDGSPPATLEEARGLADQHQSARIIESGEAGYSVRVPGLSANFSYYIDPLTLLMLFVVCGIGSLVAIYGAGYMKGDKGYARFFAAVSIFIFAMTSMVMGDNLVLLFLGWEMVGLASYLLIGYYFKKPSAAAAARKAFIVNRIGDLGFALGIFLTYMRYDTVVISEVLAMATSPEHVADWRDYWIPFLLMLGALGKSAQIPLYVWLPDAMEGPTPVSALIHAATMVTSGVYMIARLHPLFENSPYALPTVATIGGVTAFFAATIATSQFDLKKIYAYSTVSQLGYMFLGVGMGVRYAIFGGLFHLLTHAFFKALLFLTSGNVMHGTHGQLDIRKLSGLRHLMPFTCWLMLAGCLSLAAFPLTAGFFSKDAILVGVFEQGLAETDPNRWYVVLGVLGLVTAFLTPFYAFRAWFRVFMGPEKYEMGTEAHGDEEEHAHPSGADSHLIDEDHHAHDDKPHEASWLMLAPLFVLALGALFVGIIGYKPVKELVEGSTAVISTGKESLISADLNLTLIIQIASGIIATLGILTAAYFHWLNRQAGQNLADRLAGPIRVLENKYWVDEIYDLAIVKPLRLLGWIFQLVDTLLVGGLVKLFGWLPRLLGQLARPSQSGVLHGYGLSMLAGVALLVLLILLAAR